MKHYSIIKWFIFHTLMTITQNILFLDLEIDLQIFRILLIQQKEDNFVLTKFCAIFYQLNYTKVLFSKND